MNSSTKFTEALVGILLLPRQRCLMYGKTDLLINAIKMWPGKKPLGFKMRKSTPFKHTL